jgi:hypothetical protein
VHNRVFTVIVVYLHVCDCTAPAHVLHYWYLLPAVLQVRVLRYGHTYAMRRDKQLQPISHSYTMLWSLAFMLMALPVRS